MSYYGFSIQSNNPKSHSFKKLVKKKGRAYAGKDQLRFINRLFQPTITFSNNVKKATVNEYCVYQVNILQKIFTILHYHRPNLTLNFKITQTNYDIIKFYFCPSDYIPGHFYLCFKYRIKKILYSYDETLFDISYDYADIIPQKCPDGNIKYYFAHRPETFYPQVTGRRKHVNMDLTVITECDIHFKDEIKRIESEKQQKEYEENKKKERDAIFLREKREKKKRDREALKQMIKDEEKQEKKMKAERKAREKNFDELYRRKQKERQEEKKENKN